MRSFISIALLLTSSFYLISCSYFQNTHNPASEEFKTKTGKTIIVTETHPLGNSLSTIVISTKDFEHNYLETFKDVDPVADLFIAVLDENGFDEIYIITMSAGAGIYGNVLGFASNKDKSLSGINISNVDTNDRAFKGYMGHDVFSIKDQKLIRSFPIYVKEDTNQKPTGGNRNLIYGLIPGEAMWQLKIEKN